VGKWLEGEERKRDMGRQMKTEIIEERNAWTGEFGRAVDQIYIEKG
jgi:hypothetical protein